MSKDRTKLIDELFTRALETPVSERDAYLDESCADGAVRDEVRSLLKAATSGALDEQMDLVRDEFWADVVATDRPPPDKIVGERIGAWRVINRLARGGLATVYLARRDDGEFEQDAAFKVLRRGLDTDDVVARFLAERQILSSLDHPAIARILDGGALPDGRPYLVLEYVDGQPITAYCNENDIPIRDRIGLIIQVLRALHHAHRHTVVHRDIKPSNILVSTEGNVALLDFGIAKLLDPDAVPGSSTLTRTGVSLLTPGYASPEQHAGEAVTTASDIYQVGQVLFELLTGRRPQFEAAKDSHDNWGPPSGFLKDSPTYKQVVGDLDAIVRMAMRIDPRDRYGSATEMIADLERYLDGKPVLAQPDTVRYRFSKLTRRRPWLLPVAATVVLGLIAYVTTLTIYSRQLLLEQQRAEAAQQFMVNLFQSADPFAATDAEAGRQITVVEALDFGRRRVEAESTEQPELRAALMLSIASVYQSLGQHVPAIELASQALPLNVDLYGEQSAEAINSMRLLANAHYANDDVDAAREYFDRQLEHSRILYADDGPALAAAEIASGIFENGQGKLSEGEVLLESAIDRLREAPEQNARLFIQAVNSLIDQHGTSDPASYVALLDEGLQVATDVYGENSLYAASMLLGIARNSFYLGRLDEAKANYAVALGVFDRELGPDHRDTIGHWNNYGFLLMGMKDDAAAEIVHRELIERLVPIHGENYRLVADNYQNLGGAINRQGRFEEALLLHQKARTIYLNVMEDGHLVSVFPLLSIAYVNLNLGDGIAAESAAAEALATFRQSVPDSYLEGVAMCLVGLGKEMQGDLTAGAALVEESHALMTPVPPNLAASPYPALCRVPGFASS